MASAGNSSASLLDGSDADRRVSDGYESDDTSLPDSSSPVVVPAKITAPQRQPADDVHPGAVLLVEDNPINLRICTSILKQIGAKVVQATDGSQAIARCEEQPFSLILMDLQMPICDGLTATKAIREGGELNCTTPIVALTANVGDEERTAATAVGMQGFLTKPYSRDQIRETVAKYVRAHEPASSS
jgi:CheY-like chemotaxis protein